MRKTDEEEGHEWGPQYAMSGAPRKPGGVEPGRTPSELRAEGETEPETPGRGGAQDPGIPKPEGRAPDERTT